MAPARGGFIGLISGLVIVSGAFIMVSRLGLKKKMVFLAFVGVFSMITWSVGSQLLNKRHQTVERSVDFRGEEILFCYGCGSIS